MIFDYDTAIPLYQQVATQLEDAIAQGAYPAGSQVPSTTEMARDYRLNLATVRKGMALLVDSGLLEKRRGIGMFVTPDAQAKVLAARQATFTTDFIDPLIRQAQQLGLDEAALHNLISGRYPHVND